MFIYGTRKRVTVSLQRSHSVTNGSECSLQVFHSNISYSLTSHTYFQRSISCAKSKEACIVSTYNATERTQIHIVSNNVHGVLGASWNEASEMCGDLNATLFSYQSEDELCHLIKYFNIHKMTVEKPAIVFIDYIWVSIILWSK